IAEEEHLTWDEAAKDHSVALQDAVEGSSLLEPVDRESFLAGRTTPLLFGAALSNIGVRQLLDVIGDLAPAPAPRPDAGGAPRPLDAPFSGVVFKMQAGMDPNHRDHVAFVRVCSGEFQRGMIVTHAQTGRPFATKYALSVFGRTRETLETAFPGDVVGLVNATALAVGDSVHAQEGRPVVFPPMPVFAPEHFVAARAADPSRSKQFRRGIGQLEQEGVVQVLVSEARGDGAPILAAVGPLQFEVASFRMQHEFNAPMRTERLGYSLARIPTEEDLRILAGRRGVEVARRSDGLTLALFEDVWRVRALQREHPGLTLAALPAGDL
ncbi:MAG TPA: peptide chain release factor 3, partial [Actinotalea sp.]